MKENKNFKLLKELKLDLSDTVFQIFFLFFFNLNYLNYKKKRTAKTDIIKSRGEKIGELLNKEELSDKFKSSINEHLSEVLKAQEEIKKFLED